MYILIYSTLKYLSAVGSWLVPREPASASGLSSLAHGAGAELRAAAAIGRGVACAAMCI